jgi:hypothetical protein
MWPTTTPSSNRVEENELCETAADCYSRNRSMCKYPEGHANVLNVLKRIGEVMQGRCCFVTGSAY